ncbi:DUF4405 domain-containing protein [Fibrobacterota bacterium]
MKKPNLNFLIDTTAFVLFVFLAVTGVLMRYILPPGTGRFAFLWGLNRHDWGRIHFWVSVSLLSVLSFHLFLHWKWILCVIKGINGHNSGLRMLLGIIGFSALLGMALSPLFGTVEKHDRVQHESGRGAFHETGGDIRGYMTLRELELATGMPYGLFLKELNLPLKTSPDERIGRLGRIHGFSMNEVRKIISKHGKTKKHYPDEHQ